MEEQQQHQRLPNFLLTSNYSRIALAACLLYSGCSMLVTFSNKIILAEKSYSFAWPMLLLLYQHVFSVVFVQGLAFFEYITVEPLKLETVKKWLPLNMLFVAMLLSNSYALRYLSVATVTVFKNFTTIIISGGDYFIFNQPISSGIISSLVMMFFGSVVAGYYDLEFDYYGYLWMTLNCIVSAGYVLYMRLAMKGTKLSEFGNVFYNNALSIPFVLALVLMNGLEDIGDYPYWHDYGFIAIVLFGGISSVGISFASFWTVRTTSPTTYSIVGSLNKIPLTILAVIFFSTPLNVQGGLGIIIGLFGGVVYSLCKANIL